MSHPDDIATLLFRRCRDLLDAYEAASDNERLSVAVGLANNYGAKLDLTYKELLAGIEMMLQLYAACPQTLDDKDRLTGFQKVKTVLEPLDPVHRLAAVLEALMWVATGSGIDSGQLRAAVNKVLDQGQAQLAQTADKGSLN